ncbi:efflux RND transporter periplasmic adaptor subunit [Occallatibacter riparius]|uniref:Efflux RND transporter periplasmic adaptor subunit n=1 Tax=Occallatibacter riparius TaxID=1002689 RepID=A0A9J7BQE7_9BACT|nr:efflux RND transporter periplasmic adaptor subunit [Occallatibacter riparius]UWZ85100.1 efflux RND transporter periplasmic adaptor subunit [Occallatibacter riparius]
MLRRLAGIGCVVVALAAVGCKQKAAPVAAQSGMQAMPVQTVAVTMQPVPQSSEYVGTIKSRRSATLQPQVDGRLTGITVKSGDRVKSGQVMMTIDPLHQQASVDTQQATERQKKAMYDYNTAQLDRQKKLFEAGIISRELFDQAQQAYDNSKADYESAVASRKTQEEQLAYYTIRAPFDGIVGDVPVHVGDYVSSTTVLTTVDENKDLEAYIYIPTERAGQLRPGLEVNVMDTNGNQLEKTSIDFISPQVDNSLQGILVKAPVHFGREKLRNSQLVKVQVVWNTAPTAVVPVLAVMRQGGQPFVFVAREQGGKYLAAQTPVTLGDTVGNNYAVTSGLQSGEKVIVSSTQFLTNGAPVILIPG